MRQRTGDAKIEQQHFVALAVPLTLRSSQKSLTCQCADFMIVNAEKCRSWLRYVKRNHRNIGFAEEVGEFAGDTFVDLKLNRQIEVLFYQYLRVAQRNLEAVLVVQLNQIHLMLVGSPAKALTHCTGK